MQVRCLINGESGESVAADDRGLHYGDGLFETLAVRDGVCEFWGRHLERLQLGCERLRIPSPAPDLLAAETRRLTQGVPHAVLKILLTRGSGGR
ncbi:MAG TPA: aminotransferase class IV, partial [Gammaproteobacteria bacterium]